MRFLSHVAYAAGNNIGVDGGRALGLAAREHVSLQGVQFGRGKPIPVDGLRDGSLQELDLTRDLGVLGLGGAAGAAFLAPLLEVNGALTQLNLECEWWCWWGLGG